MTIPVKSKTAGAIAGPAVFQVSNRIALSDPIAKLTTKHHQYVHIALEVATAVQGMLEVIST